MDDADRTQQRVETLKAYGLLYTPAEPVLDAIVRAAADQTESPMALISLVDDRRQWFKAKVGVAHDEDPIEHSICAHAIRQNETLVVPDARQDERFRDFPAVQKEGGIRFYAGVPLRLANGAAIGTLCIIDNAVRDTLADDDRRVLEGLARRTVAAFELRRELREQGKAEMPDAATAFWFDQATGFLDRAAVALERTEAVAALAHLEHAIALIDAQRSGHASESGVDDSAGDAAADRTSSTH